MELKNEDATITITFDTVDLQKQIRIESNLATQLRRSIERNTALRKAATDARQELFVDYCLRVGHTNLTSYQLEQFNAMPVIRILNEAIKL